MNAAEFRAELAALGLRQVDFVRLISLLSEQPADPGTINRWAKGRRAVPPLAVAVLALWARLPGAEQRQILEDSA